MSPMEAWISSGLMGTGVLPSSYLGGTAFETHHKATEQTTHKLENNYTKEVLTLLQKF